MFGKNIRYYRLQAGMTQEELAQKLNVKKMTISNYEKDKRDPSPEMLSLICQSIGIELGKLLEYQDGPISLPDGNFRKNNFLTAIQQEAIKEQITKIANQYMAAIQFIGANCIESTFPTTPISLFSTYAESAAYLRRVLGIAQSGPIPNLLQAVENAGIVVMLIDTNAKGFSGYSCRCGNYMTLIAINKNMSTERQRFTIAHELVHLAFTGFNSTEKIIDNIAGRFLVPAIDIKRELGPKRKSIGLVELQYIYDEYGVSRACAATRIKQEKIITQAVYETLANASFESTASQETPTRLNQLVYRAYFEGEIGINKVAELLNVSIIKARDLCNVGVSAEC